MGLLSKLFSPIRIGTMELKNRIVMAPMHTNFANEDGSLTQKELDFFETRAKGGVGLITLPSIGVDCVAPFPHNLVLWNNKFIPGFRKLAEAIHTHGAKVVPELCHPGPFPKPISVLNLGDINHITEQFGDAAVRARDAGCDGVELHAAHAFMILGSFISALRNKRTDSYGGSVECRLKLLLDVIQNIHDKAGRDFPVILRISGDELVPGGRSIRETQYIAPILAEAGIDALDISIGVFGHPLMAGATGTGTPRGVTVQLAKAVKEVVDLPVGTVGRINDPRFAEDVLLRNEADLIVMGRALLADPELPNKAAAGNFDEIAPCIACGLGCSDFRKNITCLINPTLGKEKEMIIAPADKKKKVLVVGGGTAGLEAARVAALRGHKVTLYEKSPRLGGQFNLAAVAPMKQELTKVIKYLSTQAAKSGVEVQLNKEVTTELVQEVKPDVVILATGGEPLVPDIPGVKGRRICTAHDVLAGKIAISPGSVVIVGGGMVGCEVAELLADPADSRPGFRVTVTIIEMLSDIALDMAGYNRALLLQQLRDKEVKILTSAKVNKFLEDGVVIIKDGREEVIRGIDYIILAMGAKSVDSLSSMIKDKVAEVYVIGDAKEPRRALEAIAEGANIGRKI